jgi:hypothetical protein
MGLNRKTEGIIAQADLKRQGLTNLVGGQMNIVPNNSFFQHVSADILHLENNVIDCSAFWSKFPADGKCSCLYLLVGTNRTVRRGSYNIGSIAVVLSTSI